MKKMFSMFNLAIMLLLFSSCTGELHLSGWNSDAVSTTDPFSLTDALSMNNIEETTCIGQEVDTDNASEKNDGDKTHDDELIKEPSYFCGTWKVVSYEKNGVKATIEAFEKNENFVFSNTGLILRDDGKYYFYTPYNDEIAEWKVTSVGINADGSEMVLDSEILSLMSDDGSEIMCFAKTSDNQVFPKDMSYDAKYLYGTWSLAGGYICESKTALTLAQIKKSDVDLSESKIIFAESGRCFVQLRNESQTGTYSYSSDGIKIGKTIMYLKNNLIYMIMDNEDFLFFHKVSDEQTIPEGLIDGMRKEFKDAMDSYEDFYDEYCDFMKKYKDNPYDFSLLMQYTNMLSKLADMDKKFEAWKSEDLNDAELKYYLEVQSRVAKKLIDVSQ